MTLKKNKKKSIQIISLCCAFLALLSFSPINAEETKPEKQGLAFFLTDNFDKAQQNVNDYPDSAEAHFNLAVLFSRTVYAEKAIDELKTTKSIIKKSSNTDKISSKFDEYIAHLNKLGASQQDEFLYNYRLAFLNYLKGYIEVREESKATKAEIEETREEIISKRAQLRFEAFQKKQQELVKQEQAKDKPGVVDPKPLKQEITKDIPDSEEIKALKAKRKELKAKLESYEHIKSKPGQINKALVYIDKVLAKHPNDVWTLSYKGHLVYEKTQSIEEARKYLNKALKLEPKNPAPHLILGNALMQDGNTSDGIKEVTAAFLLRAEAQAKNQVQESVAP